MKHKNCLRFRACAPRYPHAAELKTPHAKSKNTSEGGKFRVVSINAAEELRAKRPKTEHFLAERSGDECPWRPKWVRAAG